MDSLKENILLLSDIENKHFNFDCISNELKGKVTEKMAKYFADAICADLFEIKPIEPYSEADLKWMNPLARCNKEKLGNKDVPVEDAIEDIFGIYIDCDRKNGYKYFIGNDYVLHEESIQNWMLSTLSVNNVISESLSLQNRILLESIPSSDDYLEETIEAMKKKRLICIVYQKYSSAESKQFSIAPYCIKLYHRRWYVLGRFDSGKFAVFSFDRIQELTILEDTFEIDEDFSAEQFFSDCFGVVHGEDIPVQRIVIRAYGTERNYLRDLPMHHSQEEIRQDKDSSDFSYYLRPTLDFCGQILSRGSRLKVLEPQSLSEQIHQMLLAAAKNYE